MHEFEIDDNEARDSRFRSSALSPLLSSATVEAPFELSEQELRTSDIKLLKTGFNRLREKAVGQNSILLKPDGERWALDYIYEDEDRRQEDQEEEPVKA